MYTVYSLGNAAIILRSRLKVQVFKENWEKKDGMDEKGIIQTNRDVESSHKAMQYQVINIHTHLPQSELLALIPLCVASFLK